MANDDVALSSFRDPAGRVFQIDGRIIRAVDTSGRQALNLAQVSPALRNFVRTGRFIATRELDAQDAFALPGITAMQDFLRSAKDPSLVEHEAVPFPSYPYEWPPEMLHAAASLTLDLCELLLPEGNGLKDATPYNVLFRGTRPVFVDLLSVEKRRDNDPVWLPYAQFVRTFLLPLLAGQRLRMPLSEAFFGHRDGLYPADLYRRFGILEHCHPAVLQLVSLPHWLATCKPRTPSSIYRPHKAGSAEQAAFVLRHTFRRLRRKLASLRPATERSAWSDYPTHNSYSSSEAQQKKEFLENVLEIYRPKWVLDVGCNCGAFSALAAQYGADVVAIDTDPASVGATFRLASEQNLSILPLVVDIARPSPAIGWNNAECRSFLSRAAGKFDAVFMLAVLHHLLVTERIPLSSIMDLAAALTTDLLVIEYVGQLDSMFQTLLRGRQELHADFTHESFKLQCERHFRVVNSKQVQAHRWLYALRKRS